MMIDSVVTQALLWILPSKTATQQYLEKRNMDSGLQVQLEEDGGYITRQRCGL